ncbi:MAG: (deoxy)nucleoside triphosphate pyrophosphohydrolase [Sandaracinaceae bacterium]|nr:(deoxy)nucleoside triphosphate pyrophosphohydrolase [Sandaracinaceae bacterium]
MIVVAAAVIRERPGAPVLLTRRPEGGHLAGFWEFPGGKVEEGEDPEHAVVRECREEIALELAVEDILDVAWHRYREKDVLLLFYDCRVLGGELEHLGVAASAWVEPDALDDYELPPPDARLVTKLRAGR